ncbi:hypothetical protein SARC_09133 [Sphaeroforma arctica JP610]|uniref:Uncharacterized protein n=1 Tax=Sphaeroforma arctica JP610 TaxID=667725 RepID=A0A0L0FQZ8_9EUKA|nr:hypothetical protein SARC_09133 [Sphaeroforma arctica JP610]KNC78433.1 hypothetical protein SARC_09133 [Sphaeroforma arctica JP610]|eukprot:XP_014152335.1 hypothetical protein SARC_09133 [Sphaeroforma arctica JP610]
MYIKLSCIIAIISPGITQSSILGSWSPATLLFYAKNIFSGTRLEKTQVKEDLHQLGGDFIVGQDGKLLLSHPSTSPIDRVAVSDIMDCIRKAVGVSVGVSDECSHTDCSAHAHGHTNRADSEVVGSEPKEDDAEDGECST